MRGFRHSNGTALTIAASRAQIGEFSFILAALGVRLGLLPDQGRDLILAGAILSMMLNPLVFAMANRLVGRRIRGARERPAAVAGDKENCRALTYSITCGSHRAMAG